ncbi:MAG: DUF1330 domain-containing protein [Neomegalonema sp.]|nr:DUF1330 domain-containing protein [Neomegalonema sp.]
MSAFFIAIVTVKDPEKFKEYVASAGQTMAPFEGRFLTKGNAVDQSRATSFDLPASHDAAGIFEFPSLTALKAWYASPDYQALIPLRTEAGDFTFTSYET